MSIQPTKSNTNTTCLKEDEGEKHPTKVEKAAKHLMENVKGPNRHPKSKQKKLPNQVTKITPTEKFRNALLDTAKVGLGFCLWRGMAACVLPRIDLRELFWFGWLLCAHFGVARIEEELPPLTLLAPSKVKNSSAPNHKKEPLNIKTKNKKSLKPIKANKSFNAKLIKKEFVKKGALFIIGSIALNALFWFVRSSIYVSSPMRDKEKIWRGCVLLANCELVAHLILLHDARKAPQILNKLATAPSKGKKRPSNKPRTTMLEHTAPPKKVLPPSNPPL